MSELQPNYADMSKEQLVSIIKSQKNELISQEAVIKEYKKHLEQVIEFNSVEKYRETVNRNRGAARTTPQGVIGRSDQISKVATKEIQSELEKREGITTFKIDNDSSATIVTEQLSKEVCGPAIITINID